MSDKKVTDIFPRQKTETEKENKAEKKILPDEVRLPRTKKPFIKKSLLFLFVFLILLGGFFYFTLSKAEVEIWPETETLNLEMKLTADSQTQETSFIGKTIPAQVLQKEKTLVESFQSSGQVLKEEKAEGTIRIYNEYSTSPQVLVATTRFVSVDGKVFRTPVTVTIPGGSYQEGKFVSGQIDVNVVAGQPGPEYNIGPSTFSIPGFAGTDRYTKFYGESSQSMSGGLRQEISEVTEEDLARAEDFLANQAEKECEEVLESELQSRESASKASSFLGEFQAKIIEKTSLAVAGEETEEFKFQTRISCETLLFKKEHLDIFAKESITNQISQEKEIYEESLKIDYQVETVNLNAGNIILSLQASAKIYSAVDLRELKRALSEKSLLEAKLFLENQPEITRATVSLWPFWVKKVPEDLNKIKIGIRID